MILTINIDIHKIRSITQNEAHQLANGTWVTNVIIENKEGKTLLALYTTNNKKLTITASKANK